MGKEYDVIIIGGGITGAGTARDCAMRGLKTLIIERFDFTAGATGRNHGLLHSGARYAVTDQESARECIKENMVLRRIARHCVEETEGLFVTLPEDDLAYQSTFVESCLKAGIRAEVIAPEEALRLEPSVNRSLIGAVRVPDGAVDPFRLTIANVYDARLHGADVLTYHEVTSVLKENGTVVGVEVYDAHNKVKKALRGRVVINAGGIWGHRIAEMAGVNVSMFPAKGALLIFGHRVNNMVINRCRKPADADILVPGDTISLIGTTSSRLPYDQIDDMKVTPEEVDILLREGSKLAPELDRTRILRAYAGVRPLVAADNDPTGRNISRGIVCLDHETRDGVPGFVTITGGKLMTYRLMAERATDLACRKLGVDVKCRTAEVCLPGSEETVQVPGKGLGAKAAKGRHGAGSANISVKGKVDESLVCECEGVSVAEVNYAVQTLEAKNISNLRRRTRLGMGTCQGELCACRAAGLIAGTNGCARRSIEDLASFMNERWKGVFPVAWGDALAEAQFTSWIYEGVCGLDMFVKKEDEQ